MNNPRTTVSHITQTPYTPPSNLGAESFAFNIGATSDCFVFYAQADQDIMEVVLTDANGHTTPALADKDFYKAKVDANGISAIQPANVPARLDFPVPIAVNSGLAIAGQWTCRLSFDRTHDIPKVIVAERVRLPAGRVSYVLPLNVVIYASQSNRKGKLKWVTDALAMVQSLFHLASIQTEFDAPVIQDLPAEKITDDFTSAGTSKVVLDNAVLDKVTLIFVEDFDVRHLGEQGISGGIPGPQGFQSQFGAALVRLPTDSTDVLTVNKGAFAYVIAHEIGHYLGLTHGSAQGDPTNLMYPKVNQCRGALTEKQMFLLRGMPVVRLLANDSTTPVSQVVVTIRTGTTWPSYLDGPGTNMYISFSLGSESTSFERWELNNTGQYFASGQTSVFTLQAQNLNREDLRTWIISTDWSPRMWIPFIGGPDVWDFAHITVVVDGSQVYDGEINEFVGAGYGRPANVARDLQP